MIIAACVFLLAWSLTASWYLFKFVRLIMAFEDTHSEAIEGYYETIDALMAIEESLDKIIQIPIFFESQEIREVIDGARNETKISRLIVRRCAEQFIKRSKKKDISYVELVEEPEEVEFEQISSMNTSVRTAEEQQFIDSVNSIYNTIEQNSPKPSKPGVTTVFGRTS